MRNYIAVGDIHGRYDLLDQLMRKIVDYVTNDQENEYDLIFLGDYIDRGPDSKKVLDYLMDIDYHRDSDSKASLFGYVIFLKGNHEDMALKPEMLNVWMYNGGYKTLKSFGPQALNNQKLPDEYLEWMDNLKTRYDTDEYVFVHAGVNPDRDLDDQDDDEIMWIRNKFLQSQKNFGKIVVFGHTPMRDILHDDNKIGVDTGAFATNKLSAVVLAEDGLRDVIQTTFSS